MATIVRSTSPVQPLSPAFSRETLDRAAEVRQIWNSGEPMARVCAWCDREITEDHAVYPLGGRLLHDGDGAPECRREFDHFTREG